MKCCDAIIVGAGPAGSTCAHKLREAGLDVQLFDKKVFPRVKPCAGWVTPQVLESLQIDLPDYRRENTLQPITGFRTGIIGGRMIETEYQQPVSYGILRIEFDDYLLRRSQVPCEFQAVKTIQRRDDLWRVNGEYSAPLLIGAGGHFCPVARELGKRIARDRSGESDKQSHLTTNRPVVVYAQEVEFAMSQRQQPYRHIHPEKPELYFCADLQGYGWCFRKGGYLNIGLGRADKQNLTGHVQEFCDFLRINDKLVDELPPHFLGHAYQLYVHAEEPLYQDGVLLVGDAAGLAYPNSGEGIRPAIESALIAADVVVSAANYSSQSLAEYQSRLVARLGSPKPNQLAAWIPGSWLQILAARLMATRWFAKNVVIENWFLHRSQDTLNW